MLNTKGKKMRNKIDEKRVKRKRTSADKGHQKKNKCQMKMEIICKRKLDEIQI